MGRWWLESKKSKWEEKNTLQEWCLRPGMYCMMKSRSKTGGKANCYLTLLNALLLSRAPLWNEGPGRGGNGRGATGQCQLSAAPEASLGPTQAPSTSPALVQRKPTNDGIPACNELTWHPIEILDLKHLKEAVVLHGFNSPFVKKLLNAWARQNRLAPSIGKDWCQLF